MKQRHRKHRLPTRVDRRRLWRLICKAIRFMRPATILGKFGVSRPLPKPTGGLITIRRYGLAPVWTPPEMRRVVDAQFQDITTTIEECSRASALPDPPAAA